MTSATRSILQAFAALFVTLVFSNNTFAVPGDTIRVSDKCSFSADTAAEDHLDIMAACSKIIASQDSPIWQKSLAQFVIGRVLEVEGQINRAKFHYGESLELDTSNIDALFNLAILNWKTDDNEIALHQIKQYIDSDIDDAGAHHLKALLEEELGDPITARRDFEFSFRLDPQRPGFLYDYVAHLQKNLEWAKALEIARGAAKISPNDADTVLQITRSLFHLEEYGEALEWLEKIETAGPNLSDALFLKARILTAQGQLKEANLIYEEVIKISDEYYNAYYNHALNSYSLPEYERAFEMIEKFLSHDGSDADAWELAGKIHLKRGNHAKAGRAFAKAFEFADDRDSMLGKVYQNYELDGMFEPFHELSRNLMTAHGETGLLLKYAGMVQSELNRCGPALTTLSRALVKKGHDALIYGFMGWCYGKSKNTLLQKSAYASALAIEPRYEWVLAQLGLIEFEEGDYKSAAERFRLAAEVNPEVAYYHSMQSGAEFEMGNFEDAITLTERALELDPEDGYAHRVKGLSHYELDDYSKAILDLNKALELEPDTYFSYLFRGRSHRILGNMEDALADFDHAISLLPDTDLAYYSRGILHKKQKQFELALLDFERASELDPSYLNYKYQIAKVFVEMEQPRKAIETYLAVLSDHPRDFTAHFAIAQIHADQSDYEKAVEWMEKASLIEPGHQEARSKLRTYRAKIPR